MSTIVHIYADGETAATVAKQLTEAYFEPFVISSRGPDGSPRPRDAIVADLTANLLDRPVADAFADALANGGTVVGVHPMFGTAFNANRIFDGFPSVDPGIEREHATAAVDWTVATPISTALGWPVLLDHNTSMSESWRIGPLLAKSGPFFSWFGFPLLSEDSTPASKIIGAPVLIDEPAPLSKRLNIPTLLSS